MPPIAYDNPRVISPTQTCAWLKCRQYWAYTRKYALQSEAIQKGRIFAASVAAALKGKGQETPLVTLALDGLETYGVPELIEHTVGTCTPDYVAMNQQTHLMTILDHKLTGWCLSVDVSERLDNLEWKWQLRHYAYFVSQYLHYNLDKGVQCGINYIIEKPKPHKVFYTWIETQESLDKWIENAIKIWQDIHENSREIIRNETRCIDKYGPCYYYKACYIIEKGEDIENLYNL